mmetsp:Transcript_30132/g.79094  ORF Transcript_30132/g.79094 Transcript_30132/m.79094 type:complete len:247 (-) Transcript_30132:3345-4085(-)
MRAILSCFPKLPTVPARTTSSSRHAAALSCETFWIASVTRAFRKRLRSAAMGTLRATKNATAVTIVPGRRAARKTVLFRQQLSARLRIRSAHPVARSRVNSSTQAFSVSAEPNQSACWSHTAAVPQRRARSQSQSQVTRCAAVLMKTAICTPKQARKCAWMASVTRPSVSHTVLSSATCPRWSWRVKLHARVLDGATGQNAFRHLTTENPKSLIAVSAWEQGSRVRTSRVTAIEATTVRSLSQRTR